MCWKELASSGTLHIELVSATLGREKQQDLCRGTRCRGGGEKGQRMSLGFWLSKRQLVVLFMEGEGRKGNVCRGGFLGPSGTSHVQGCLQDRPFSS